MNYAGELPKDAIVMEGERQVEGWVLGFLSSKFQGVQEARFARF